jgi:hypothetical protein
VELSKELDALQIATRLGIPPIEVSRSLRRARVLTRVQPWEMHFIVEQTGRMPDRALVTYLGMTTTQLDQIRRRHGIRRGPVTRGICVAGTRWVIEEQLGWPVDDDLPRRISNGEFTSNGLYPLIAFATREKAKDSVARHFSAVAFLVCLAYPGRFKPWQFRHAKTNDYFSGPGGKRNLLDALLWVVDEKLKISRQALPHVLLNSSFLNASTIQRYGLGAHWWREHWSTKGEMLETLARHAGVELPCSSTLRTAEAREKVAAEGLNPRRCAVPGCRTAKDQVEIHHIVPKGTRKLPRRFDVHAPANLIPLCRRHHGIAGQFRARDFDLRSPATLRSQLLAKLDRGPAAAVHQPCQTDDPEPSEER